MSTNAGVVPGQKKTLFFQLEAFQHSNKLFTHENVTEVIINWGIDLEFENVTISGYTAEDKE